jgi:DNA-binding CsgD family transcriptional regulator
MVLKLLCDQVFRSATEPSYLTTAWSDFLVSTILPCFIMLVIAVIFIVTNQPDDCEQYYRYIIPVASIFVLLASLEWIGGIGEAFTSTSYLCLEFMLWMELCVISHRYRISPILVAGFGRGAMAVGMLCIGAVTAMPLGLAPVLESGIGHTFMLVMLVVGYSLLPREKDIRAMAVLDPVDEDTEPLSKGVRTGGLSSEDEKQKRENRFIVRCQRIANMFLLSPREMEVFLLLAKGRNTAYISKALFISEGTVHTHTRRIYKKLDIHRQQELIDMVDASYANAAQSKTNIDRAS